MTNEPKVVFFDVDETLLKGQSQQALLHFLFLKNKIPLSFFLKICAWFFLYGLGLVKSTEKIRMVAVSFLKNWPIATFQSELKIFFDANLKDRIYEGALEKIRQHLQNNDSVVLLSSAIEPLVAIIAEEIGVHDALGSRLETRNFAYTGNFADEPLYGKNKLQAAQKYLAVNNLLNKKVVAYADHLTDTDLLDFADFRFVVNPKKKMRSLALREGWEVLQFKKH
ncbi:MAG: HAD-IB family hydrolase [Patescibacteria group bacterium]